MHSHIFEPLTLSQKWGLNLLRRTKQSIRLLCVKLRILVEQRLLFTVYRLARLLWSCLLQALYLDGL